jgi:hypothetical protein
MTPAVQLALLLDGRSSVLQRYVDVKSGCDAISANIVCGANATCLLLPQVSPAVSQAQPAISSNQQEAPPPSAPPLPLRPQEEEAEAGAEAVKGTDVPGKLNQHVSKEVILPHR